MVSEQAVLGIMAEGTRDYKRLESMLKEVEQNREKDMSRIEGMLKKDMSKVEGRLDTAVAEIKALINGITFQCNELRTQMNNRDNANHGGSILGNPGVANGDMQGAVMNIPTGRYATKLDFPRFGGEGVDDWLFRVEQFFILDRI